MQSDVERKAAKTESTTSQQCADVQRAAAKLKTEMFKSIAGGRGRKRKGKEFPELAYYTAFASGDGDRVLLVKEVDLKLIVVCWKLLFYASCK